MSYSSPQIKIDLQNLQDIITKTNDKIKDFKFYNETSEFEILYLANRNKLGVGKTSGLFHEYFLQYNQIKEQIKLRSNAKNYCKIYKKNNKIHRIDSYANSRLDVIHLAFYEKHIRYLVPFSPTGGYYPTYTYVTHFSNEFIDEEYAINPSQIIYENYKKIDNTSFIYSMINSVPSGTVKILQRTEGTITKKSSIEYNCYYEYVWKPWSR